MSPYRRPSEPADPNAGSLNPASSIPYSDLRRNSLAVINGRPAKVVDVSTSKAGWGAKCHVVAFDIFTGKKIECLEWSTHKVEIPDVRRTEYTILDIEDGFLQLLGGDGIVQKGDLRVPEGDLGRDIYAGVKGGKELTCTVVSYLGEEQCVAIKEKPNER